MLNSCGQRGHGNKAPTKVRKVECPAYGESCGHCGIPNHLAAVCRGKNKPPPTRMQLESAIFDSLCNVNTSTPQPPQHSAAIQFDHHLYHSPNKRWIQQPSQAQPFLALTATAHPDDYRALGLKPVVSKPHTAKLTAMADTSCHSCLAGMKVIRLLGLGERDLLPVTLRMHVANNNGITILGAVVLRFSRNSHSGQILETRQIVYVTSDTDKLFLSREACTALGMITEHCSPALLSKFSLRSDPRNPPNRLRHQRHRQAILESGSLHCPGYDDRELPLCGRNEQGESSRQNHPTCTL